MMGFQGLDELSVLQNQQALDPVRNPILENRVERIEIAKKKTDVLPAHRHTDDTDTDTDTDDTDTDDTDTDTDTQTQTQIQIQIQMIQIHVSNTHLTLPRTY